MTEIDRQWRRALDWVLDKTRDVLNAEAKFRPTRVDDPGAWIDELDRLRAASDRCRGLRRGVIERDAEILGEVMTAMTDSGATV